MRAYRKYLTIMIATESSPTAQMETLHSLLKTTQALPQASILTDADLAAEVAAVRTR
jgi:hypothetical protein